MREILFRGKTVDSGRWIFGDLSNYGDGCTTITTTKDFSIIDSAEVIAETVCQSIDLIDKNKKNVFEHDIVKVYDLLTKRSFIGVVKYFYGSFYIYDTDFSSNYRWMDYEVEVIGNVYDDVNLLEGE